MYIITMEFGDEIRNNTSINSTTELSAENLNNGTDWVSSCVVAQLLSHFLRTVSNKS